MAKLKRSASDAIAEQTRRSLSDYFARMAEIRGTGGAVKETSYYSVLENLLNNFGATLSPKVICNGQLRSQGAGHPDFGLYSKDQVKKGKVPEGQLPSRGVIEVKGLSDLSWQTAKGKQASKYFDLYRHVLVTNYREFRLIVPDAKNSPVEVEFFRLADSEAEFWQLASNPQKAATLYANRFDEFLRRVLTAAAPLERAEDVAWFLASYAREALAVLEQAESGPLEPLRKALQLALGVQFEGKDGEHFFRSTLVQTLFYGVFSAWVNQAREGTPSFDWRTAGYSLHVPTINVLFSEIAKPSRLGALKVSGILDRTAQVLNRVNKKSFFATFDTAEAIQHFYEPFLKNFDPDLRKQLGVWYTPPEIVKYMVERVDQTLRAEMGIADGLADKNVFVLDPCCGTGAYLVEVLRKIESNLRASGTADALLADDIKEAALTRVFGFELMSAPYVVAHWQVGSLLSRLNTTFNAEKSERPAIYLTNALTGWDPPQGSHKTIPLFPEFEEERDKAGQIKRDVPILVVLGNPPYNAFAGVSPDEEQGLVEPYKQGLAQVWGVRKYNLDELYLRFLRIAERRVVERTGRGIVCFVSSYSYLSDASFVVARRHLLNSFHKIWIDSLNGDSRETGKTTPDGKPDPSAFSTEYNREGIKLGTAIGLFVRSNEEKVAPAVVRYRDFWGSQKRADLLASVTNPKFLESYSTATPTIASRFNLRPQSAQQFYDRWPSLAELAAEEPYSGAVEKRKGTLIAHSREELEGRISAYLNTAAAFEGLRTMRVGPVDDAAGFDAKSAREKLIAAGGLAAGRFARFCMYPFDVRWCFHTTVPTIWNRGRPELAEQQVAGNLFIVSRIAARRPDEGVPVVATRAIPNDHLLDPNSHPIPVQIHKRSTDLFGDANTSNANLSRRARAWLAELDWPNPDASYDAAAGPWLHALAIAYSSKWLSENREGILAGWPKVPLPSDRNQLERSAQLGKAVAELLDTDAQVQEVTAGTINPALRSIGMLTRLDGGQLLGDDLVMSAGWGHGGNGSPVMPGQGKISAPGAYDAETLNNLQGKTSILGFATEDVVDRLGPPLHIWLNENVYWSNVPERVWNYFVGGYPVIKKWLSYREHEVLGRSLTKDEARYVTNLVRRLSALAMLGPALDLNYSACRDNALDWSAIDAQSNQPGS